MRLPANKERAVERDCGVLQRKIYNCSSLGLRVTATRWATTFKRSSYGCSLITARVIIVGVWELG
jgi:hypothetical protein